MFRRSSGIVLHPTCLPGPFGVGDLGPAASRFADFLVAAGQGIWQVLPLGPTGYGDSPYQCFSAFAGNPLLISPEKLVAQRLLSVTDLEHAPDFAPSRVDYNPVNRFKRQLLDRAFTNFQEKSSPELRRTFLEFQSANAWWLEDYALFMSLKEAHGFEAVWTQWEQDVVERQPAAIAAWRARLKFEIHKHQFWQWLFFLQWAELKRYCGERGIQIMGDLPIYVAHDNADVWAHPELFCLKPNGEPENVAGVPPDYFSATGQLWGNPLYRWEVHAKNGYQWWIERLRSSLTLFDICRVDHFRGFAAYWEIPAGQTTATRGRWVPGPKTALFEAAERALGKIPIVAENLGVITEDVEALRNRFGFPGMSILQFAFGNDRQAPDFRPHNYPRNRVAYTGTHDNDTTVGWWTGTGVGDSTRTLEDIRKERAFARRYLDLDEREINWVFIRAVLGSVADLAMFPLQDVLGLGSEARMNVPGTSSGNWRWRFTADMLRAAHCERLKELSIAYERVPGPPLP